EPGGCGEAVGPVRRPAPAAGGRGRGRTALARGPARSLSEGRGHGSLLPGLGLDLRHDALVAEELLVRGGPAAEVVGDREERRHRRERVARVVGALDLDLDVEVARERAEALARERGLALGREDEVEVALRA